MPSHDPDRMSRAEWRAGGALAAIFGLRMLGLFLILPVFAVHAKSIPGGDNLTLVGIALGAYGLTQAFLQIPFGAASDRYGRKPVIVVGLALFALGSFLAAWAPSIGWIVAGRCLQGAGAISAAVTALAADLTREQHRTKVMAMIGSSIGLVFAGSLVLSPVLYAAIGLGGLFALTGALAIGAIALVTRGVPSPPPLPASAAPVRFMDVLRDGQLARLNLGIFTLHLVQMAMFVVVPAALVASGPLPLPQHWKVYLPVVLASFVAMVPAIIAAERKGRLKQVFLGAVGLLLLSQLGLRFGLAHFGATVALLFAFFVAFNVLEASLPSLISRIAPPQAKGAAMGIYNTTQSAGAALGGVLGGWVAKHYGADSVHLLTTLLVLLWLAAATGMRPPLMTEKRDLPLGPHADPQRVREQLAGLAGVREAVVVAESRIAHLRVTTGQCDEARLQAILDGR